MSKRIAILLWCLASLAVTGCVVGGAGGGGGGGVTLVGGAVGAVCDPNLLFQGCYAGTPMQCDPATNSWKAMAACPSGQFCIEKVDTASGKPQYRTASCVSGGSSSTADVTTGGSDSGSGGDTSNTGDTPSSGDSGGQDIASGDTAKDIAVVDIKPGPECGNGVCEEGESKTSCSQDCGGGGAVCGNGACEAGESQTSCSQDCGSPTPVCGNGACEAGETTQSCAQDCKTTVDCCVQNGYTCGYASKCGKDCGKCASTQTCTANKCVDNGGSCLDTYCSAEWDTCVNDSKCVGIIGYLILNSCAKKFSCQDNACTQSNCSTELSQCQQTPGCVTFATCVNKCTSDACVQTCFDTANGYLYDEFGQCADTNCP